MNAYDLPDSGCASRGVCPKALVIRAPGSNCDRETAQALELAGANAERVHVDALVQRPSALDDYDLIVLPGGFAFGDHLGAGTIFAHRLAEIQEQLSRFVESGRPLLGICNGFQALMKLGILSGGALAANESGHFECRWVWLERPKNVTTPLLNGIDRIALPVANGEGRFVAENPNVLNAFANASDIALVYAGDGTAPVEYPANPNGSDGHVAALTNKTGNVLGLMPHPERNVLPGQAPEGRTDGAGLRIFRNAVAMARGAR